MCTSRRFARQFVDHLINKHIRLLLSSEKAKSYPDWILRLLMEKVFDLCEKDFRTEKFFAISRESVLSGRRKVFKSRKKLCCRGISFSNLPMLLLCRCQGEVKRRLITMNFHFFLFWKLICCKVAVLTRHYCANGCKFPHPPKWKVPTTSWDRRRRQKASYFVSHKSEKGKTFFEKLFFRIKNKTRHKQWAEYAKNRKCFAISFLNFFISLSDGRNVERFVGGMKKLAHLIIRNCSTTLSCASFKQGDKSRVNGTLSWNDSFQLFFRHFM